MADKFGDFVKFLMNYEPKPARSQGLTSLDYRSMTKPSSLAKAIPAFLRRTDKIAASIQGTRQSLARSNLADRRALCAEFNAEATRLAEAGELTAEQGAQIDVMLHNFGRGL